jgi:AraC-like DNA-binding protein
MDTLYHYFILFGIILSVILAIGQIVIKNRSFRNYILAGLMLCIAIAMSKGLFKDFLVIKNSYFQAYSFLLIFDITALTCVGPLLYLYIQTQIKENYVYSFKRIIPLLLSLAVFIFMLGYYIANDYSLHDKETNNLIKISVAYIFSYEIFILFSIINNLFKKRICSQKQTYFCLMITCIGIIQAVLWHLRYWQLSFLLISVIFISIYILSHRDPHYLQINSSKDGGDKYSRSQLSSVDVKNISNSLLSIMQEKNLHRDEEINLTKIANHLNITGHQLSELLNKHLKKSFTQFINEYRIDEAQNILKEEPESSILSICYQVGFNSNSAFYNAFKNIAGMNPKEYRKKYTT